MAPALTPPEMPWDRWCEITPYGGAAQGKVAAWQDGRICLLHAPGGLQKTVDFTD